MKSKVSADGRHLCICMFVDVRVCVTFPHFLLSFTVMKQCRMTLLTFFHIFRKYYYTLFHGDF